MIGNELFGETFIPMETCTVAQETNKRFKMMSILKSFANNKHKDRKGVKADGSLRNERTLERNTDERNPANKK